MAVNDRVVWKEGMFLRPQHFQQQDRFVLSQISASCAGLQCYRWGFEQLEIDQDLLKVGKLAVTRCQGVLPDGTPFSLLENNNLVLDLGASTQDLSVFLCLPVARSNMREFSENDEDTHIRCGVTEQATLDNADDNTEQVGIHVGKPRFQLLTSEDELDSYQVLAVTKVVQVGADRNVTLEQDFIPATLDCNRQPLLRGFLSELEGMLHQRAESIAGRVSGAGKSSTEISDFLLLQALNRIEPEITHLTTCPDLHPESLYRTFLSIAGELATFTRKERRPATLEHYNHDDLHTTFIQLMNELRQSLSTVLEQAATQIDLSAPNQYGISTASVGNREMLQKALFVLAVRADTPDEKLRQTLPGQMKIGAVEKIAQLINKSLPGVGISPLPAAPRQIPFHAGTTYFQLDTSSAAWADVMQSGGIAMHIAGQYPGLDISFWAVRQ